ncbi:hypothetical protein LJC60_08845 [Ruminococcaceae bacterium OttesenSCG-928-D13]|nr:hypothetical protein [Ruminococcaceae bacterium OttesenSCG-928-D13]
MLKDNIPSFSEKYDQWLHAEFGEWLARCMNMSHEELIKDSSRIYVDLFERNSAAYAAEDYKVWAVKNGIYDIESLQIDDNFNVYPDDIGEALKQAASGRERSDIYIPIDSYKPWELRVSLKRKVDSEYQNVLSMFRCMDKKNLILHTYELTRLEMFHDALTSQLSTLPLDRAELINLHYQRNLLETVFADNIKVTLDELLAETECLPDLLEHFPLLWPDCPSHPGDAFRQKVEECYGNQIERWLKMTPQEFREQANRIACVMDTHRRLMNDKYGGDFLSVMIRLKDPLTVVSTKWETEKTWDIIQNYSQFSDCIETLVAEQKTNPQIYELDERYHAPEHHPPSPKLGVTMC